MAKQTKKNETAEPKTKKAKKEENAVIEEQIEQKLKEIEENGVVQDISDIDVNINDIEAAINQVDVNINGTIEKEQNQIGQTAITGLKEITNKINDFENAQKEFNKNIEQHPENAKKIIEDEIKRIEKLKKDVEKIIKANRNNTGNITSWWNGMGYDF